MTRLLVEAVQRQRRWANEAQALSFVCGALVAHDAAAGGSAFAGLDVERVFAAVQLLRERQTLEVTPFVAAWHPAVDAWDRPELPRKLDDRAVVNAGMSQFSGSTVHDYVLKVVRAVTGRGEGKTYESLSQAMVQELRSLLATDPDDTAYLGPLLDRGQRPGGLTIATLNYDLAVEQAGEQRGVAVDTGIAHWSQHRQWNWSRRGVRLLKLHGSIDWEWFSSRAKPGHLAHSSVRRADQRDSGSQTRPAIVFGRRDKLRAEGPFLSLLAELEAHLRQVRRLIIVGYSFRDEHINEVIKRWTAEDDANHLLVIDPGFPEHASRDEHDFRTTLVKHLVPGVWWPGTDFRPRLEIRRTTASDALKTLFA
jgi:hypothetical protein